MTSRGKIGQAKHDNKVASELEKLKDLGYKVKADLPGRTRPPKVGGVIPDIYARRGNKVLVEEIETKNTLKADKPQQEKLKKGTEKLGGDFKVKIAK